MKIAYVEDQPSTVQAIVMFLRNSGHEVTMYPSLEEFLEPERGALREPPALLVLDIMMKHGSELEGDISPLKTGLEVLRRIRRGVKIGGVTFARDLPVLVITAIGDSMDLAAIQSLNPIALLEKPVSAHLEVAPVIRELEERMRGVASA